MNSKEDIDSLVSLIRFEEESRVERLKAQKRLFIFAVEIGRGKKLIPHQRSLYENTFLTALLLSGVAGKGNPNSSFDKVADGSVGDWLDLEPKVKAWLERVTGHSLAEVERSSPMPPEIRQLIADKLTELYGNELSQAEIADVVDRLEHPLDRA
jgi:hypothetical protein